MHIGVSSKGDRRAEANKIDAFERAPEPLPSVSCLDREGRVDGRLWQSSSLGDLNAMESTDYARLRTYLEELIYKWQQANVQSSGSNPDTALNRLMRARGDRAANPRTARANEEGEAALAGSASQRASASGGRVRFARGVEPITRRMCSSRICSAGHTSRLPWGSQMASA